MGARARAASYLLLRSRTAVKQESNGLYVGVARDFRSKSRDRLEQLGKKRPCQLVQEDRSLIRHCDAGANETGRFLQDLTRKTAHDIGKGRSHLYPVDATMPFCRRGPLPDIHETISSPRSQENTQKGLNPGAPPSPQSPVAGPLEPEHLKISRQSANRR